VSRKGCARAIAIAASVSLTPCFLLFLTLALITNTIVSTVAAIQQEWRSNGEEEDDGGGSSNSNVHFFAFFFELFFLTSKPTPLINLL